MARVLVLGSTGSIGVQALEVIDRAPDLTACGLSCGGRVAEMAAQAAEHGIAHTAAAAGGGTVRFDPDLDALIEASQPDLVLNAIVGRGGPAPDDRGARARASTSRSPTRRAWWSAASWWPLAEAHRRARSSRSTPSTRRCFQLIEGEPAGRGATRRS